VNKADTVWFVCDAEIPAGARVRLRDWLCGRQDVGLIANQHVIGVFTPRPAV